MGHSFGSLSLKSVRISLNLPTLKRPLVRGSYCQAATASFIVLLYLTSIWLCVSFVFYF